MNTRSLLAATARQIESARNHAVLESRRHDGAGLADPVLRSLRTTYVALSTGLDPWKDAGHLFTLKVGDSGEHSLTQDGLPVPVNAPYLAYLFWTAGVELLPGQVVFLEPELAKDAIEEALGVIALEQAFTERERLRGRGDPDELRALEMRTHLLWDRKIELVAASLVADEYLERSRNLDGPEAA